jgi:uncharacterized protein YozE (UPF0346 family)
MKNLKTEIIDTIFQDVAFIKVNQIRLCFALDLDLKTIPIQNVRWDIFDSIYRKYVNHVKFILTQD